MSNKIQIALERDFFSPGDIARGQIVCNFTTATKVKCVVVQFTGRCTTSWTETERYYDDFDKEDTTRHVPYSGDEIYFHQEHVLAGEQTIPPGQTAYNFSYQLPDHLPSSYEGYYGWGQVRYTITATVGGTHAVALLTVISPLDLNFVPRIMEPVEISVDKVLCSCWCNSDPLTFTFSLPRLGYVPGENVSIGVHVANLTNKTVQQVLFKITEFTEFVATTPRTSYKHEKEVIAYYSSGGAIGAHGDKSWTAVLTIPKERYFPNLVPCNLISKRYELKGEVVLPMPHSNLTANVPLTIGNVQFTVDTADVALEPPREVPTAPLIAIPEYNPMNYGTMQPTAPPNNTTAQQLPPSYDEEVQLK